MDAISTVEQMCPYCGEVIELVIDGSVTEQRYIEDCFVCCQPIVVTTSVQAEELLVTTQTTDE